MPAPGPSALGVPLRTRVKICGITSPEDARVAAAAGADAIGLVFYPPSPRLVSRARAAEICRALPPMVTRVAVFVDATEAEVAAVAREVPIDLVQFHGEESPARCASAPRPCIKALHVRPGADVAGAARRYAGAVAALLLDTHHPALPGGTGVAFDWTLVPDGLPAPVILAGGINATNVAEAVRRVRPFAIDVSGGVERERGVKDPDKIVAFMREVHRGAAPERQA